MEAEVFEGVLFEEEEQPEDHSTEDDLKERSIFSEMDRWFLR